MNLNSDLNLFLYRTILHTQKGDGMNTNLGLVIGLIIGAIVATTCIPIHTAVAAVSGHPLRQGAEIKAAAPIATSGNYAYVVWPSNKTTSDFEIMFKASTDGGKTWSNKTNLSNTPNVDSINAEINAAGNNVYVTWWERANQTMNEPVLRVSNDNGKTFGEKIMLSAK
jgi:hypothetical protein